MPETFEDDFYLFLQRIAPTFVVEQDAWEVGQILNKRVWECIQEKLVK